MKKLLLWLLLPTALVAVLELAVHFKKLPVDFWSLSLADKWKALKAFWTPPATTPTSTTNTVDSAAALAAQTIVAAQAAAAAVSPPKPKAKA